MEAQFDIPGAIRRLVEDEADDLGFDEIAMAVAYDEYMRLFTRYPSGEESQRGHWFIHHTLEGNPKKCKKRLKMNAENYRAFCTLLVTNYELMPTRNVNVEESVGMFMCVVTQGAALWFVQALFGRSTDTISRHVAAVRAAICKMAPDWIRPHRNYNEGVLFHKPIEERHYPFKDCIGAIDGTHIPCVPPRNGRAAYMGRKRTYTQNVLCICDFNMCFTYIEAGWEGSVHDARMLRESMTNIDFPHPGPNKYYLVDAGFPNVRGYLAPYRGRDTRYWHQEFRNAPTAEARRPRNANEKFNYLHSTCRIIIERTFGIWKKRFKILSCMPSYNIDHQTDFVIATAALHNYIRNVEPDDDLIDTVNEQLDNEAIDSDPPFRGYWDRAGAQLEDRSQWDAFRSTLRQEIVEQFE